MPAVAVTDRNNLFGALEFAQYAAKAGIQPIIGCELGIRREEEGGIAPAGKIAAGRLADAAGPERDGLSQPDAAGEPRPSRIQDRLAGGPAAVGAGGPHRGPAGPDRQRRQRARPAAGRRARTPAAAHQLERLQTLFDGRLYIELQRHGEDDRARGSSRRCSTSPTPRPAAGRHQRRAFPQGRRCTRRTTCCSASSRARTSRTPTAAALTPEHYFKSAAEMRQVFADLPEACDNTLVDRPALRLHAGAAQADPAALHQARRPHRGGGAARDGRDAASTALQASGRLAADIEFKTYEERLDLRARHDREDGLLRLLPDRRRLHPVGQGPRHPGRAGPRLGRGLAGRLVAQDHRPRSAALGPAVRALPQSRARVDAGLRHRLLPGQARRGDPLRARRVRPRPRRRHHHLRQAAGARGAARRRPRARHALRPGRPHLQAGAEQSGQAGDAGPGAGERAAAEGAVCGRRGDQAPDRPRAAARRPLPQRLDPCRRRGDRRPAARRAGAALPRYRRQGIAAGHPVQHEVGRDGRAW